jgi:ABC-2 type transport system permease protein
LFIMPMVQLVILANATTFEVKTARLYVVDRDNSSMSRGVVNRLAASGRFLPTASSLSMTSADDAMLNRRIDVIISIPEGFERDLIRDHRAQVQLILNAEDGSAAGVTQSYAGEILASYSSELGAQVMPRIAAFSSRAEAPPVPGQPRIEIERRGWYNPELDYRDYMIPGILVQLVTMVGTLLTAMNIVREKESGTLDQLNVTPVTRSTFIAAKLLPLWSLALLELAMGLTLAHLLFGTPIRGSIAIIFLGAALYLFAALGVGLWVSTVAETQQQAMFVTFAILMVYMLMSGLFTPVSGMPKWGQWAAYFNPVMHFTELMRAVMLKGAQIRDVQRELLVLAGAGALVLTVSVRQYRKRAD